MGLAVLIRHGRSTANVDNILAGRMPGVTLATDGQTQADLLAEALDTVEFASIHVSPLQRTQETAQRALSGRSFITSDDIVECDYGTWTGQPIEALRDEPLWATLHSTPSTVTFPEGESITEIAARAVAYVCAHAAAPGLHAFVSHADVIMMVANAAVAAPLDRYQRLHVEPASMTLVRVEHEHLSLVALNVPPSGAAALLRAHGGRDRANV